MFIEFTKPTYLHGNPVLAGEIYEVDEEAAKMAIEARKARIVNPPAEAHIEPPKTKAKRVS